MPLPLPLSPFPPLSCSQDADDIEAYYRKKYAEAPEGEFDEYEEQPEEIRQQSLLPGVK